MTAHKDRTKTPLRKNQLVSNVFVGCSLFFRFLTVSHSPPKYTIPTSNPVPRHKATTDNVKGTLLGITSVPFFLHFRDLLFAFGLIFQCLVDRFALEPLRRGENAEDQTDKHQVQRP